jgi:hypothetical protein
MRHDLTANSFYAADNRINSLCHFVVLQLGTAFGVDDVVGL